MNTVPIRQPLSQPAAAGLALTGYTFWVLTDAALKVVGTSALPLAELMALVGVATALAVVAQAAVRGSVRTLWPRRPGLQAVRALLDLGNNVCVVIALRHLPLAVFYLLIFLAPLVATLMARVLLRERLTWRQVAALLVGFAGVVVAVGPLRAGRPGDRAGYVACVVCVLCFATNMVWSRRMTQTERSESMTFFSGLVIAVLAGAVALPHVQPLGGRMALVLAAVGVFAVAGNLCFFAALRATSAATVSQFHYSQLLTGALLAFAVWGERVTPAMVVGGVLITAAGVYTAAASRSAAGANGREALAVSRE